MSWAKRGGEDSCGRGRGMGKRDLERKIGNKREQEQRWNEYQRGDEEEIDVRREGEKWSVR